MIIAPKNIDSAGKKTCNVLLINTLHAFWPMLTVLLFVCVLIGGCAAPAQPAASSILQLTPEEKATKRQLSAQDRQQMVQIMTSVAENHEVVDPPHVAEHGVRWSDIPIAMTYACKNVEMAIVKTIETDDQTVFELKTIDNQPGRFEIHQVDDNSIYEIKLVEVGRFSNPKNQNAAMALKEEFEKQLRLFGKKRALKPLDD